MPWKCFACIKSDTEDIVKLDYRHYSLTDVPPEVFAFERTLEELYLDANRIKDLPRPLFHCHGLRHLGLSDNEIQSIPAAISSLVNLEHLDISKNAISDIPDSIKGCKLLATIDASVNPLEKLPEGFMQLLALEELYLNDAYLEFLPANFGRLQKLRILELRENHLNTLPKSIARLVNLQRLDIGQNEFSDVPEVVGQLPNITELWCDFNRIRSIPPFVGNLKKLVHLDASNNNINWIASDIENCAKLSDLTLSGNEIQEIPGSLGYLKSLMTLKLDDNQLSVLPEAIGKLATLEELILSQNDFETLPPSIGLLRKLHILNVDENMLEDLPPEIGSCCNLRILSVAGNRLIQIPGEIGHLHNLKVANFSGNRLNNLPVSLLGLSSLAALWLSDNQAQPLVPLQPDVDPLTGQRVLTCFMLPQTCSVPAEVRSPTEVVVPGYIPVGDSDVEGDGRSEEERIRRRHIRFAADSEMDVGGRLLRAPTPYPKELRALARHARSLQRVSHATNGPVNTSPPLCQGSFFPPHQQEGESATPVVAEWIPSGMQENKIKEAKVTKAQSSPVVVNEVHDAGMPLQTAKKSTDVELARENQESSLSQAQAVEPTESNASKALDLKNSDGQMNDIEDECVNQGAHEAILPSGNYIIDPHNNAANANDEDSIRSSAEPQESTLDAIDTSRSLPMNESKEELEESIRFLQSSSTPPSQPPPYHIAAAYSKKAAFFNSDVQSRSSISSLPPQSLPGQKLAEIRDMTRPSSVASKYELPPVKANHTNSELSWPTPVIPGPQDNNCVKDDLQELSERVEASLNELGMTVDERVTSTPTAEKLTSSLPGSQNSKVDLSSTSNSAYQNISSISSAKIPPLLESTDVQHGKYEGDQFINQSLSPEKQDALPSRNNDEEFMNGSEQYGISNSMKSSVSEEDDHHMSFDSSAHLPSASFEASSVTLFDVSNASSNPVPHEFDSEKSSYSPEMLHDSQRAVTSRIPVSKSKLPSRSAIEEIQEISLGKPPNFTQDKPSGGTHLIAPTPQRVNTMPVHNNSIDGVKDFTTPVNNSYVEKAETTSISPSRIPSVSGIPPPKTSTSWQRNTPSPSYNSKVPPPGFYIAKRSSVTSPTQGNNRQGILSSPVSPSMETSPSQLSRQSAPISPQSKIPQLSGSVIGSNGRSTPSKGSDAVDKPHKTSSSKIPTLASAQIDVLPADAAIKSKIPVSPQGKQQKNWMFGLHKNATVFPVSIHKNPGLGFSIAGGHHPNVSPDKQDGIYITKIHPTGPASRSLHPGDKILEVDGIDFSKLEHDQAVSILTRTGNVVQMMVSRQQ